MKPLPSLLGVSSAVALLALGACGQKDAPPPPPPAVVTAIAVQPTSIPNVIELPGRIQATRSAEVRARTDGIVERRLYEEGTDVREGAPLFRLDQRDYRAQVQQAQASLMRAQAARTNTASIVNRYRPLVSQRAVSAQEFDAALANLRSAEADVANARATLTRAQLQLSYTTVRAPIAGRVGRAEVTEGALVSAASATLMTRIDQMSPLYAVFAQPNADTLDLIREQRAGTASVPPLSTVIVHLRLENGADYAAAGRLDFADQTVDPATGSQTLRAIFPNPDRVLRPGQFVRGRIELGRINGIAVPQRAVQLQGDKASVTLVNRDGSTTPRPVELGDLVGGRWVIESGLKQGDMVIVEGWQKAMPGQKVQVRRADQTGPTPPPSGQPQSKQSAANGGK